MQENNLDNTVIANRFCVGCGVCAATVNTNYQMSFTENGAYIPIRQSELENQNTNDAQKVCPFGSIAPNETQHAQKLYPNLEYDENVGRYLGVYVGYAVNSDFRMQGSSGGLTNWILSKLLESNEVDGVFGVSEKNNPNGNASPLFEYSLAKSKAEIQTFAKSKYYPIELSKILSYIRNNPGRYAIVGVPCFAKAIRNICEHDPVLKSRIKYVIAIVCGHLKSAAFAENLAWQVGISPGELKKFDFRVKVPNQSANRYAISAVNKKNIAHTKQVFDLYGTDWGLGFFKLKACDYCDDIAGETADVTLGDAWLPNEIKDWQGTNILIVRNQFIADLLMKASLNEEIVLRGASVDEFVKSQSANYRHRRKGLSYRLHLLDERGFWKPEKRIKPSANDIPLKTRKIIEMRERLSTLSHLAHAKAKEMGDLTVFYNVMRWDVIIYYAVSGALTKFFVKSILIKLRAFGLGVTKLKN